MKYIDEFRYDEDIKKLANSIAEASDGKQVKFMEVCGTHTMSIARFAIPQILPKNIKLISGPGCPVCVTPCGYIDAATELAKNDVIITTFGDMVRVPGSDGSLADARANGAKVNIVYSPLDALEIAKDNPEKEVVFLGVGFETTTPTVAYSVKKAKDENVKNFSVLSAHKLVPPALMALADGGIKIDGLILPGHVSVIIGKNAYLPLFEKTKMPMAITGFEPTDIMLGILSLTNQIASNEPRLETIYKRVVRAEGNKQAKSLVKDMFDIVDVSWRGIGIIPKSGLAFSKNYESFDAEKKFNVEIQDVPEPKGCKCGNILKGELLPNDCPLFGKTCTPEKPVGPCMVSSEGTCAAYYKYGRAK